MKLKFFEKYFRKAIDFTVQNITFSKTYFCPLCKNALESRLTAGANPLIAINSKTIDITAMATPATAS